MLSEAYETCADNEKQILFLVPYTKLNGATSLFVQSMKWSYPAEATSKLPG